MIDVIITSFNEPKTIGNAIDSFLKQDLKEKYNIWVVAPDKETLEIAKSYSKNNENVKTFVDPGKGKSYALHEILPKLKGEIIVLSDGDVFVKKNSLKYLVKPFEDKKVGCVTGRPVSLDDKNNIFGYWSHLLCDAGAHKARLKRYKKRKFLECSGYFWAFRNNVIKKFPLNVAEDSIVPFIFAEKKYKIAYSPKSIVYVSFPKNLKDFIEQKKRTAKSHEKIPKYVNVKNIPQTKTFKNELLEGYNIFFYPKNLKEILYTITLIPIRLYIWFLFFYHTKIKKEGYGDAWKRIESTK